MTKRKRELPQKFLFDSHKCIFKYQSHFFTSFYLLQGQKEEKVYPHSGQLQTPFSNFCASVRVNDGGGNWKNVERKFPLFTTKSKFSHAQGIFIFFFFYLVSDIPFLGFFHKER